MQDGPSAAELSAAVTGPAFAGLVTFLFTLAVDLGSKLVAVSLADGGLRIVYNAHHNGDLSRRLLLSLAAVAAVSLLSAAGAWRGTGRLWGAWIGLGLLLAGIAGNGLSHVLWQRGTPDFIWAGRYVWNLADFAIGIGLASGLLSVVVVALHATWRDRTASA